MKTLVHGSNDPDWDEAVRRLRDADVYHTAAYHRIAEANDEGRAHLFVAVEGTDVLVHPFLRRTIGRVGSEEVEARWSDIESVYGYSGPLASTTDPAFLARAWSAFGSWCRSEGVVAEFIRFNPLAGTERFASKNTVIAIDRETVALDLPGDAEVLWSAYPSVQRNMVRKAQREGLSARITHLPEGLDAFRALYAETMERVRAEPYYDFDARYFDRLADLGDAVRLVTVERGREGEGVAAAAVLFVAGERLHYHLSASSLEGRRAGANNLLLHNAARWGVEHDLRVFHLGGGRTPSPEDALLRFKASVGSRRLPFRTGRIVHDAPAYAALCATWRRQRSGDDPPYFLLYRLPLDPRPDRPTS